MAERKAMSKSLRFKVFATALSASTAAHTPPGSDAGFRYFCGICWSKIREAESGSR